ncbi:Uncharacterised protein [Porphyromonas macacae]|uniref:Integrase n=1 Tax=Porphyromonas macacae TaxID=28115 RepID=A0A379E655_9PORP|nr:Uncharacterised protein [Porphyromonas macacae]
MAQFSYKLSCDPTLWNARESRLNGKSREAVVTNGKLERLLLSIQSAYLRLCERGVVFLSQLEDYIKRISGLSQGSYRRITLYSKKILRLVYQEVLIDRLLFDTVEIERGENRVLRALDKVSRGDLHHQYNTRKTYAQYIQNPILYQ